MVGLLILLAEVGVLEGCYDGIVEATSFSDYLLTGEMTIFWVENFGYSMMVD